MGIGENNGNRKSTRKRIKAFSIQKLTVKRPEVLVHAGVGEDCAVLAPTENALVLSTDPITASAKEIGTIAFHITANDIASSGAELVGILLTIIMPPNSEEGELKQIMDDVSQLTAEYHVEILGGHTEVSAVVNQTLVSVTGIGRIAKDKLVTTKGLKPGQDLVVTKWVGLEGTSIIATEFEKELKNVCRFQLWMNPKIRFAFKRRKGQPCCDASWCFSHARCDRGRNFWCPLGDGRSIRCRTLCRFEENTDSSGDN